MPSAASASRPERAGEGGAGPAVTVLRHRRDFLAAARARRASRPGFTLQARLRPEAEVGDRSIRVGYTCSKKLGGAVERNRAKRRLRALARSVLPQAGRPGWDYVLVGRPGTTARRPFALMLAELAAALEAVHAKGGEK